MGSVSLRRAELPALHSDQARDKEQAPRASRHCAWALILLVATATTTLPVATPAQPPESVGGNLVKPWDAFFSVACLPSGKCYVVGTEGALLTSKDSGRTWERRSIAERGDLSWFDLYSIRFAND